MGNQDINTRKFCVTYPREYDWVLQSYEYGNVFRVEIGISKQCEVYYKNAFPSTPVLT